MTTAILSQRVDGLVNRVIFTETDAAGVTHGPFVFDRPVAENETTFLSAWETQCVQSFVDDELLNDVAQIEALGSLATPTFRYVTAAAVSVALRAAYQSAMQLQAVMIADFLNTLTDAQLQTLFNLTAAQVTALRTNRLQPAATLAANMRASTGQ